MVKFEIYCQQLLCLGHGLALYEPDPAGEYDKVRVGDVGHMDKGGFHRLFNVFYTEEHDANRLGVPEGFEPVSSTFNETYMHCPLPAGAMCLSAVQNQGVGVEATLGPGCVFVDLFSFSFH